MDCSNPEPRKSLSASACDPFSFVDKDYHKAFTTELVQMRKEHTFTDIIIRAGDIEIACHKLVLSAASPYFKTMFHSGMKEATSGMVDFKETSPAAIQTIVDYIYTSEIGLTTENVVDIAQACDQFDLQSLKSVCDDFMAKHLEPSNSLSSLMFSKLYNLDGLLSEANKCILGSFKEVVRQASDSEYSALNKTELVGLISNDELDVLNEDLVFEFVVKWVEVKLEEREGCFPEVLQHVRLPYCTPYYLCNVVNRDIVVRQIKCQTMVHEAIKVQYQCEKGIASSGGHQCQPRNSYKIQRQLVIIGGIEKDGAVNKHLWYLQEGSCEWQSLTMTDTRGCQVKWNGACVVRDEIVQTGGYGVDYYDSGAKCSCSMSNMQCGEWKCMPSLQQARYTHATVSYEDKIYVVGGTNSWHVTLDTVERFDFKSKVWMHMPSMKKALKRPMAVAHGNKVYVMGGLDKDSAFSASLQTFDLMWGHWELKQPMPSACDRGAAVVLGDRIYVVGGLEPCCLCYTISQDTWAVMSKPTRTHAYASAVVWEGKILLTGGGGMTNDQFSDCIEEYDPETDRWSVWKMTLPMKLGWHKIFNLEMPS